MIIGIDPGATGALAVLGDDGALVNVSDMPTIGEQIGRTMRNRVNAFAVSSYLEQFGRPRSAHVFLEKVNGMPRDGGGAAFVFGKSYGIVLGVLATLNLRHTLVPPAVWKKAVGCPADKGGARARAMQLFPQNAELFSRVKDDGRSEAALIAYYGLQIEQRGAL